jgi:hypothetical protein
VFWAMVVATAATVAEAVLLREREEIGGIMT